MRALTTTVASTLTRVLILILLAATIAIATPLAAALHHPHPKLELTFEDALRRGITRADHQRAPADEGARSPTTVLRRTLRRGFIRKLNRQGHLITTPLRAHTTDNNIQA